MPEDKAFVLASSKRAWRSSLRKEAFPFAQQDWIDEQQDLIRKAVFEQRRSQR